ncbi:unnamed protein product [Durusdinium trenchii]|uniref:Uncharacterized protein n=1 Tax=Durusdinium trenchii TaxID=1381693 RepID=A0ABP0PKN1_9DINO
MRLLRQAFLTALLLSVLPWLFVALPRRSRSHLRSVGRLAQKDMEQEESRLDAVAGSGELPEWLMEATGGVPKERKTEGVDFSWDYRAAGAVIFALTLLYVGVPLSCRSKLLGTSVHSSLHEPRAGRMEQLERRVARLEELLSEPVTQGSSWECMTCNNVMKFLKALQGEVSTLRRALPMSEEVHAMKEVVNSMQGSVELMRNKTQAMERSLREVNGHIDSSHSSLLDKQTRLENAMGVSLGTELPQLKNDLKGLDRDLRLKQDSWLKEAGMKLQAMQSMPSMLSTLESDFRERTKDLEASIEGKFSKMEGRWAEKCSCFVVEITRLVESKLETKLDVALWEELRIDMEASVSTLREVLRTQRTALEGELKSLRSSVDFRGDEIRALNRELRKLLVRGVEATVEAERGGPETGSYTVVLQ